MSEGEVRDENSMDMRVGEVRRKIKDREGIRVKR
jgi:hypothetical protein